METTRMPTSRKGWRQDFFANPDAFWQRVDRGDGCWLWKQSVGSHGYGQTINRGRVTVAHRVAWELTNGPIPPDKEVCHTCDNRRCCNPAHLFLGTRADNMADAKNKGRTMRGEKQNFAKLTEDDVREIRRRRNLGEARKTIAQDFGITPTTVGDVMTRTWRHVV